MKHEIGPEKPETLKEEWPGQWSVFSFYEQLCCVPGVLYLVTTQKESGKTNAGWFSSVSFHGDGGGHFALLPGIMQSTHTYQNIVREKEFVVNFLSSDYDVHCRKTIGKTPDGLDELEAAGLTAEASKAISTPRVKEAFLSFECKLVSVTDLSGRGMNALLIGRVVNAGVDENHRSIPSICKNFSYNIRAMTDDGETSSFARLAAYN
jgi:flavin reductase (DIM6/NTAB) family NADH-FMN oxidoreductase RutF